MKAEVNKLHHLGIDYVVRRSTLSEANKRRPQEFFAKVYAHLLERYGSFLADSRPKGEQKTWEKLLYMMSAYYIYIFNGILLRLRFLTTFSKELEGTLRVVKRKAA